MPISDPHGQALNGHYAALHCDRAVTVNGPNESLAKRLAKCLKIVLIVSAVCTQKNTTKYNVSFTGKFYSGKPLEDREVRAKISLVQALFAVPGILSKTLQIGFSGLATLKVLSN